PGNEADRQVWGAGPFGFQPLVLMGKPTVDNTNILWVPDEPTKNFLSGPTFQKLVNQREIPIIAHFTLKGNFIASQSTPPLSLDGDDFAQRGAPRNLRDPIG